MQGQPPTRLAATTLIETTVALAVFVVLAGLWLSVMHLMVVPLWQDEALIEMFDTERALNDLATDVTPVVQRPSSGAGKEATELKLKRSDQTYLVGVAISPTLNASVLRATGPTGAGYMPLMTGVAAMHWQQLDATHVTFRLETLPRWRGLGYAPGQTFEGVIGRALTR